MRKMGSKRSAYFYESVQLLFEFFVAGQRNRGAVLEAAIRLYQYDLATAELGFRIQHGEVVVGIKYVRFA